VITVENWAEIRRLHRSEGISQAGIVRRLGISRNTVSKALASDRPPKYERVPLGLAVGSVILVPISTQSGEALEERVSENSALERHTQLGEGLLGWVIGLVLIAAAMVAWDLWRRRSAGADAAAPSGAPDGAKGTDVSAAGRPMSSVVIAVVLAVAAIAVGTGTIVQAVLIGHSGAQAVWGG